MGGHVARRYAAEGAELRLLTRQTSRLDSLAGLNAETVVGDLREPEKLRSALTGCSWSNDDIRTSVYPYTYTDIKPCQADATRRRPIHTT